MNLYAYYLSRIRNLNFHLRIKMIQNPTVVCKHDNASGLENRELRRRMNPLLKDVEVFVHLRQNQDLMILIERFEQV